MEAAALVLYSLGLGIPQASRLRARAFCAKLGSSRAAPDLEKMTSQGCPGSSEMICGSGIDFGKPSLSVNLWYRDCFREAALECKVFTLPARAPNVW